MSKTELVTYPKFVALINRDDMKQIIRIWEIGERLDYIKIIVRSLIMIYTEEVMDFWQMKSKNLLAILLAGLVGIMYVSFKISHTFMSLLDLSFFLHIIGVGVLSLAFTYIFKNFILMLFDKVEKRWGVKYKWELIVIFIVFSITGSSSILIGRPVLKLVGITTENLNMYMYYPLFIMFSFLFYQIFLVLYGWLFGQFKFFWTMEKKMLKRFGITI